MELRLDQLDTSGLKYLREATKKAGNKAILVMHYLPREVLEKNDKKYGTYKKAMEQVLRNNGRLPVFVFDYSGFTEDITKLNQHTLFVIVKTVFCGTAPVYRGVTDGNHVSFEQASEAWNRFVRLLLQIGVEKIFITGQYARYKDLKFFSEYHKGLVRNRKGEYPSGDCVGDAFWQILKHSAGKIEVATLKHATYSG